MDDKQIRIVRRVLNEHIMELEDTIKDLPEADQRGMQDEKEACEEALKLISKGCEF